MANHNALRMKDPARDLPMQSLRYCCMSSGRIKRKQREEILDSLPAGRNPDVICPLCGRTIPPDQQDAHHLVPRSLGGKHVEVLHRICHRQLHALISEKDLASNYASIAALLAHPEVARFVAWVRTKPPGLIERTRRSARRADS